MSKIKLLVITRNDSRYTVPSSYYFIKELSKVTDLRVSHDSGKIGDILTKIDFKPDFIYFNDYLENGSPNVTNLSSLLIPFAVGLHDLHFKYPNRKKTIKDEGVNYIFTYYRDKFLDWYPEFSQNMRWIPHHANTEIYKDYNLNKDIEILMTGSLLEEFYPLRVNIQKRFESRKEFVHHQHPGYRTIKDSEKNVYVGKNYAMELNRAKICITCDSIYRYPLMKYFEITACNALLLAPYSQEIGDLGFIPGVNFVSIDEYNFEEKVDYYLKNPLERERISLNGMKLSHQFHSTKRRVKEFLGMVDDIMIEKPD
jgi:hypothetical protein